MCLLSVCVSAPDLLSVSSLNMLLSGCSRLHRSRFCYSRLCRLCYVIPAFHMPLKIPWILTYPRCLWERADSAHPLFLDSSKVAADIDSIFTVPHPASIWSLPSIFQTPYKITVLGFQNFRFWHPKYRIFVIQKSMSKNKGRQIDSKTERYVIKRSTPTSIAHFKATFFFAVQW